VVRLWFTVPPYLVISISLWLFAHWAISVAFRLGDLLCMVIDCPAVTSGLGAAITPDDVDNKRTSASGSNGRIMSDVEISSEVEKKPDFVPE